MNRLTTILMLTLGVALTSCTLTLNSIFTSDDVVYDPMLEGSWKDSNSSWTFRPMSTNAGRYTLDLDMKDQPTTQWYATLGTVGADQFLEIIPKRCSEVAQKSFYGSHFTELRSFWKLRLEKDRLTLTPMSTTWINAMAKNHKLDIAYEGDGKRVRFLSASTQELRNFIGKYANDPEAFPDSGEEKGPTLTRSGEPK